MALLTLIQNAETYTPKPTGKQDVLFDRDTILQIGKIDQKFLAKLDLDLEIIDGKDCLLTPSLIDPHAHFLGGSGEQGGFSSQTPEITLTEFTLSGITTAVGTLGVDTSMKTMAGLLGRAKGYEEQGMSAYIYTGGYSAPPATLLENVRHDIMFIQEIIGVGEIAIADERSDEPTAQELSKIITQAYTGGMLTNKAGVTHFHVGEGERRLKSIFELIDSDRDIKPEWLYPTHIERTKTLLKEGVKLAKRGSYVDMDVAEGGLVEHLKSYIHEGGPLERLTVSSDASKTRPGNILDELKKCLKAKILSLEKLLPLVSTNAAKILKLKRKGHVEIGCEASLCLFAKDLDVRYVFSKGEPMVREGEPAVREKFLKDSNRKIQLKGDKA